MKSFALALCIAFASQLSGQQFCLETFADFQAHFNSLFSGTSSIDSYGNVKIDGQTGGFGGWPEFRLADVDISIEHHPARTMIQGEPAPPLATIHYNCRKGACITTTGSNRKMESAYTMMSASRADRCFELILYCWHSTEF